MKVTVKALIWVRVRARVIDMPLLTVFKIKFKIEFKILTCLF